MRNIVLLAALPLIAAQGALAFGTINGLGQSAEHERITRRALGCGLPGGPDANTCFKDKSLNELASDEGDWGAIGSPDNPLNGRLLDPKSHYDNGDALVNGPDYQRYGQVNLSESSRIRLDYREISSYNCRRAIEDAKQKLREHGLLYIERWKIHDFYDDGPEGNTIVFVLDNKENSSLFTLKSALDVSKNIINNCSEYKVYKVEFGLYQTGFSVHFGLLNGEVKEFKEGTSEADCGKWGFYCNT